VANILCPLICYNNRRLQYRVAAVSNSIYNIGLDTMNGGISMSIPQHAFFSIFSGKALLFLGAGFSKGAQSLSLDGQQLTNFPGGQELAADLMKDLERVWKLIYQ